MNQVISKPRFLIKFAAILSTVAIFMYFAVVLALSGYDKDNDWTGFNEYPRDATNKQYHPPKRLWDWMSLLIVPLALATGGFLFNQSQAARDRKNSEDNNRETTLQIYIDKISELMLKHNLRNSESNSEVRDIARTRTLVTLNRLDASRKGILLRFLQESDLIGRDPEKNVVDMRRSDLRVADLRGQDLSFAMLPNAFLEYSDLSGCTLTGAELRNSKLQRSNLSTAKLDTSDLREANLERADLSSIDLARSDLRLAILKKANLRSAILIKADLRNADLCGANLTDAVLTDADLREALYDSKTKFPRGFILPKEMILSE